jgi:hypothetical protein
MVGGTVGPAISAALVDDAEGYDRAILFALAAIAASAVFMLPVALKARREVEYGREQIA